jgi:hypothetical protein
MEVVPSVVMPMWAIVVAFAICPAFLVALLHRLETATHGLKAFPWMPTFLVARLIAAHEMAPDVLNGFPNLMGVPGTAVSVERTGAREVANEVVSAFLVARLGRIHCLALLLEVFEMVRASLVALDVHATCVVALPRVLPFLKVVSNNGGDFVR